MDNLENLYNKLNEIYNVSKVIKSAALISDVKLLINAIDEKDILITEYDALKLDLGEEKLPKKFYDLMDKIRLLNEENISLVKKNMNELNGNLVSTRLELNKLQKKNRTVAKYNDVGNTGKGNYFDNKK